MLKNRYEVPLLVALVVLSAECMDYHDTLDDHIDFTQVIADKDLARAHLDYVDRGPCNDLMMSYKQHIPTVFREACGKCNAPQKHMLRVWLEGLEKVDPQGYEDYVRKHDPDNIYLEPLKAALAGY